MKKFVTSKFLLFLFFCWNSESSLNAQQKIDSTKMPLSICVMGDVPYHKAAEQLIIDDLNNLPADCDFVVHVGDIQQGPDKGDPVVESLYENMAKLVSGSDKPLIMLPGDNEFTDTNDPQKALLYWKRHLMKIHGERPVLEVIKQREREENFYFISKNVLIIGLNLVGGDGYIKDKQEWVNRDKDNLKLVSDLLNEYNENSNVNCVVILAQAKPSKSNHDLFRQGFKSAAINFRKPVLYVHGDGHDFDEVEEYLKISNIKRLQVEEGGKEAPVNILVDAKSDSPFTIIRRKEARDYYKN